MAELLIDLTAIGLSAHQWPRAGAAATADGYAPEDIEVVVVVSVGVSKVGGLLNPDGKQQGRMVPVGVLSRPLSEFLADAHTRLGGLTLEGKAA